MIGPVLEGSLIWHLYIHNNYTLKGASPPTKLMPLAKTSSPASNKGFATLYYQLIMSRRIAWTTVLTERIVIRGTHKDKSEIAIAAQGMGMDSSGFISYLH